MCALVAGVQRLRELKPTTDADVRRWMSSLDDTVTPSEVLTVADYDADTLLVEHVRIVELSRPPLRIRDLAIDGNTIQSRAPHIKGRQIGNALQKALAIVLRDPSLNTKEHLIKAVAE